MEFPCLVVKITWYSSKPHSLNCRQKPSSPRWVCSGVQSCPGPSPMKTATVDLLLGSTIFYFNSNYLKYLTEYSFIDLIMLWKIKEVKITWVSSGAYFFWNNWWQKIPDQKKWEMRGIWQSLQSWGVGRHSTACCKQRLSVLLIRLQNICLPRTVMILGIGRRPDFCSSSALSHTNICKMWTSCDFSV